MIRSAVRRIESQGALEGGWGCHIATPPDADDTAAALLVLRAVGRSPQSRQLAKATALLKREQGRGGSWGYPQWIGATRAEETALALWALVAVGEPRDGFAVRQASRWLITNQLPVGSWPTRWYVQDLNSCFRAVFALRAAGYAPSHGVHRLAASYLRSWWQGEDGEPRTSQNVDDAAYSLLGLLEIEDVDSPAVRRAVSWIIEQQTPEGTWSSGYNGFASDAEGAWMSCYRDRVWTHAHALWALARYRRRVGRL